MKGISLSLETVVLLILMAIVLAALLSFFVGTFNPSTSKLNIIKEKDSLCLKYIAIDPQCKVDRLKGSTQENAKNIIKELEEKVCRDPLKNEVCAGSGDCLHSCCTSYCPKEEPGVTTA